MKFEYMRACALFILRGRCPLQKSTWTWKAAQWVWYLTAVLPVYASLQWGEGFSGTQGRDDGVILRREVCKTQRAAQNSGQLLETTNHYKDTERWFCNIILSFATHCSSGKIFVVSHNPDSRHLC